MTLGQYPESVPKEYLIPITHPEEKDLLQAFENIGSSIGVDDNKLSGGSLIDDFTGNGYYDIISSSWSLQDQVFLYVNNGDGTFTESHEKAGLKGITGGLNMTHTDYNNDGHLDFMILRGAWLRLGNYPNSLLRNNGDGTFTDVTEESGIISRHPTLSAAWADFNNDSYLDCFIANENFPGTPDSPCELFLNNGNGTFTNISNEVNADLSGLFKGVAIGDIDNDQDPDVYLTNLEGSNILLENTPAENQYGFKFSNISQVSQTAGKSQSFPCWFFDYDNDGSLDIFSGGFAVRMYNNFPREYLRELVGQAIQTDPPSVYRNLGQNKFQDMATQLGLNKACFIMGAGYGDMNNDGYLDLYFGTGEPDLKAVIPNRAFLNTAGQSFTEVTSQSRLGHLQKGHAISFADIDFDGDQDIYAVMGGAFEGDTFFNALFDNKNNENQWLKVKLEGTKSNRPGIGARLELIVTDGSRNRSIHRTVSNGSSFGENPFTVELGLLKTEKIQKLKITWPSGHLTESDKIEANTYYLIKENDDITTLPHKQINYKKSAHQHHHH